METLCQKLGDVDLDSVPIATALSKPFFAASDRERVSIFSTSTLPEQATPLLCLAAHEKSVSYLRFDATADFLASASADAVIVWDIRKCIAQEGAASKVVYDPQGRVECLEWDGNANRIAIAVDNVVAVIPSPIVMGESPQPLRLEGHAARVTGARFLVKKSATLITTSEDRTFKVWDCAAAELLYQSFIMSSAPFVSLTADWSSPFFATASADGRVWVHDLKGKACRCIFTADVKKTIEKHTKKQEGDKAKDGADVAVVSSEPAWKREQPTEEVEEQAEEGDAEEPILAIAFGPLERSSVSRDIKGGRIGSALYVATTRYLLRASTDSFELEVMKDDTVEGLLKCASTAAFYSDMESLSPRMLVALSSPFVKEAAIIAMSSANSAKDSEEKGELSVMPSRSIPDSSPLHFQLPDLAATTSTSASTSAGGSGGVGGGKRGGGSGAGHRGGSAGSSGSGGGSGKVVNKPVTFHTKIKSSGYGAAPPVMKMFSGGKALHAKRAGSGKGGGGGGGGGKTAAAGALKRYDDCSDPPSILKKDRSSPIHTKAITELCLLSDGSRLATAGMDNNAAVAKLPLPKGGTDGAHYAGHTAPVLAVSLSQDCDDPLLISTSADGTARLWRAKPPSVGSGNPGVAKNPKKSSDPLLLQLDSPAGNMKAAASAKKFGAEISAGRFFYLDKFLLLGYSGKVQVVKYHIEAEENLNDIERLRRHNNRYKSVAKLDLESQYTTAVGCVNSFSSPIVFAAGSNRCLKVFDMAVCKCAHTFEDAHAKAVHTIAVNEVSPFVTLPLSAYDVFVTSAADGCVKLWDLRSRMSVGRFEEHTNRVHKIGASLSPCMRFLASGSEDKVAHIYDLRKGTTLHRLHGHTQCVSDVAFHPLHSHLYTSSFDGTVRVYVDK